MIHHFIERPQVVSLLQWHGDLEEAEKFAAKMGYTVSLNQDNPANLDVTGMASGTVSQGEWLGPMGKQPEPSLFVFQPVTFPIAEYELRRL